MFNKYFIDLWSNMTDFSGRTSRSVYWFFLLLNYAIVVGFFMFITQSMFLETSVQELFNGVLSFFDIDPLSITASISSVLASTSFIIMVSSLVYLFFVFCPFLFYIFLLTLVAPIAFNNHEMVISIFSLFLLALATPYFSSSVRRLHDTGRSGLWILVQLIPIFGNFMYVFMLLMPGQLSENEWGEKV